TRMLPDAFPSLSPAIQRPEVTDQPPHRIHGRGLVRSYDPDRHGQEKQHGSKLSIPRQAIASGGHAQASAAPALECPFRRPALRADDAAPPRDASSRPEHPSPAHAKLRLRVTVSGKSARVTAFA